MPGYVDAVDRLVGDGCDVFGSHVQFQKSTHSKFAGGEIGEHGAGSNLVDIFGRQGIAHNGK